jgi:hypothetical protein
VETEKVGLECRRLTMRERGERTPPVSLNPHRRKKKRRKKKRGR